VMLYSRKNIIVLAKVIVPLLILCPFRWGLLGIVSIGPPKRACENMKALNAYVNTGGDPSAYRSRTPLITCAVESSNYEIVSRLIDLGVDIESLKKSSLVYFLRPPVDTGTTPLYAAAREGNLILVQLLVEQGADPTKEGSSWADSPFNIAVENGHASVVHYLLETKGTAISLNQYVIEKTARKGHTEVLSVLVESGLWKNNKGEYSEALAFAAQGEYLDTMKFLLSVGADIDGGKVATPPMYWAAIQENFEIAEYLINNGADVNAITPRKSETPVSCAAEFGHPEILEFLVAHGARVDVIDDWGNTPLHYAVSPVFERPIESSQRHKVIEILLKNDIDINQKNNEGKTALDLAQQRNRPEIVDWLTELGATTGISVNRSNFDGGMSDQ